MFSEHSCLVTYLGFFQVGGVCILTSFLYCKYLPGIRLVSIVSQSIKYKVIVRLNITISSVDNRVYHTSKKNLIEHFSTVSLVPQFKTSLYFHEVGSL